MELLVSVGILIGSEGVGDSFYRVYYGTGKVIGWINLVFGPCSVVGSEIHPVHYWVSHALVLDLHSNLGSHAILGESLVSFHHSLPYFQILLWCIVPTGGIHSFSSLLPHLLHWSVVAVEGAVLDLLRAEILDEVKMVRSVGELVKEE